MASVSFRKVLKESKNSEKAVAHEEQRMMEKVMETSKLDMMAHMTEADRLVQNIMSNAFENEDE